MDLGTGDRFILGGPYVAIEPGDYEATYEFDCIDIEGEEKELRLSITDSFNRELAVQSIRQFPVAKQARRVRFSVDFPGLAIEFRIHCSRFSRGQLRFTGLVCRARHNLKLFFKNPIRTIDRRQPVSLDRFHSGDGRRTEKAWLMDLGTGDRFILGGPYVSVEPGDYEATYEFDCIDIEGPEKELRLYVTDSLDRELAVQSIRQFPVAKDARRVHFSVDRPALKLEFRIHCSRFSRGQLRFKGLGYLALSNDPVRAVGRRQKISLDRFHSGDGHRTEKGWLMDLGVGDRFILGGPYAELEPGDYEVTYEFDCIDVEGQEKELRLSITDSLDRELVFQSIWQFPVAKDARRVRFSVDRPGLKIEFRIASFRFSRGQLLFTGLAYQVLALTLEDASAESRPVAEAPPPPIDDNFIERGMASFRTGDYSAARANFEASLRSNNQHELIKRPIDPIEGSFGTASTDTEIRAHIERRIAAYDAGVIVPRYLAERAKRPAPALRQSSMLLCFGQYINNDGRFMQNDMIDHYYDTAKRAGLQAEVFFVDDCSYPGLVNISPSRARARLEELRAHVARTRPDVLFFDAQYIGDDTTLSPAFLGGLHQEFGVRLVGTLVDAWDDVSVAMVNSWLPAIDTLCHFAPGSPLESRAIDPLKINWGAFPVNGGRFYPEKEKDVDISFSGTAHFGLRAYWLTVVMAAAEANDMKNVSVKAHGRQVVDAGTIEEYAATMRRSRMVINLPRRFNNKLAVTGRVWQALHCGSLLLEEHTPLTEAYFVPYVHYVPFKSAEELERLIRFFHENKSYCDLVGANAAKLMAAEYTEEKIWAEILRGLN